MALTMSCLLLTATFAVSGIGKLRSTRPIGADISTWRRLGVPRTLARPWAVRALPVAELVASIGLMLPGIFGKIAAVLAFGLLTTFTVLVALAVASGRGEPCYCFGEASAPMTRATVARNIGLMILGAFAVAAHARGAGPADQLMGDPAAFIVAIAVVAATSLAVWGFVHGQVAGAREEGENIGRDRAREQQLAREANYVPTPVPVLDVYREDGTVDTLPMLAAERAVVLVSLSSHCSRCVDVAGRLAGHRERLGGIVEVMVMASDDDDAVALAAGLPIVRDPQGRVARAMRLATPSAVLIGTDSYLAGGPVAGAGAIDDFFGDIAAELTAAGMLAAHRQ